MRRLAGVKREQRAARVGGRRHHHHGHALRTAGALASRAACAAGSGWDRSARRSAPAANVAWSWLDLSQLWCWAKASVPVATASTISRTVPPWRSGWRLTCQLAMAAVSRLALAASRSPALPTAGRIRSAAIVPPASASAGARVSTGSMRGTAVRPGRRDGVAAKLPPGEHGERQHRDVGSGPADRGDDRLPAPLDSSGARCGRQARRHHHDDGGSRGHHGRGPPRPGQRAGPPGGYSPGQPDSGRRAARSGQQTDREGLCRRHPDQLQTGGAPGGQHGVLAFTLCRE